MWIGKFKVWHEESLAMQASEGLNAQALTFLLGMYSEKGRIFQNRVAYFEGRDKETFKKRFVSDPRLRLEKLDKDQLVYSLPASEVSHVESLDRNVFFIKPVLVKDGCAHWTVASWEKKHLTGLYRRLCRKSPSVKAELVSLTKGAPNVFLPSALATLTDLQRQALDLAVKEGYYEYPRRMDLEAIAKKHNIARTTLQSHVRKAERKIMTAVVGQVRF